MPKKYFISSSFLTLLIFEEWVKLTICVFEITDVSFYYEKNGKILKTTNITEIGVVSKERINISIDLKHLMFVEHVNVTCSLSSAVVHMVTQRKLKKCDCSALNYVHALCNCNNISRKLIIDGHGFQSIIIYGKELHVEKYVGCFQETSETSVAKVACDFSGCQGKFFALKGPDNCMCITNLSSLVPVKLDMCDETCDLVFACGGSNYISVYDTKKETEPVKNIDQCFHRGTCETCASGWGGPVCEFMKTDFECKRNSKRDEVTIAELTIYQCLCDKGFIKGMHDLCYDIEECLSNPCTNANCSDSAGSFNCICFSGFKHSSPVDCIDIDECLSNPCTHANCSNTAGSFNCICFSGFKHSSPVDCIDIDECREIKLHPCDSKTSTCKNLPGTYMCPCNAGFHKPASVDHHVVCEDIDECLNETACLQISNSECVNVPGRYKCSCLRGFYKTRSDQCKDVDECNIKTSTLCDPGSTICFNEIGAYKCLCQIGFTTPVGSIKENLTVSCTDVDECQTGLICDTITTICLNVPGSYKCDCSAGFRRVTLYTCIDIDECAEQQHTCGKLSTCINNPGSFECHCPPGTIKSIYHYSMECQDENECSDLTICNKTTSFCLNTLLSYICQCHHGYVNVDNKTCQIATQVSTTISPLYDEDLEYPTTEGTSLGVDIVYVLFIFVVILVCLAILAGFFFIYRAWKHIMERLSATSSGSAQSNRMSELEF